MSICDWPEDERPRERLIAQGPAALSDAELLAVFLRVGVKGKSAVDLARDCLQNFGSLRRMFAAPLAEYARIPGMGPAKYAQLQAVVELARRAIREELRTAAAFDQPAAVSDFLKLHLSGREAEVFVALFLDAQHRLIAADDLFQGTLTQTAVYPREIVKRALAYNAASVIFAHNHPSGVAEPSQADRLLTESLKNALGLVDVRVLDHFVVAGAKTLSFAQHGLM